MNQDSEIVWWSASQLANAAGVSCGAARYWLRKGIVPGVRTTPGGHYRIDRAQVVPWLERRRQRRWISPSDSFGEP